MNNPQLTAYPDNSAMQMAWELINNTASHVFLTGKAGTGKTTLLRRLRRESDKRIVVLAPTGIAAINAGGVTIHSFLQLPASVYIPGMTTVQQGAARRFDRFSRDKLKLIRSVDTLVIDEISMVRADLLDAVDAALRRHRDPGRPFGGIQMVMVGDLYQLPPVVTEADRPLLERAYRSPYFFDSKVLGETPFVTVRLEKIYRQSDRRFLDLLNAVRCNNISREILDCLNTRYKPGYGAPEAGCIRLVTHNHQADSINRMRMDALPAPARVFNAVVRGNFSASAFPAAEAMELKAGAQVMFIRNDPEHRYFNGLIGTVTTVGTDGVTVRSHDDGTLIDVKPIRWENLRYTVNETGGTIEQTIDGTFTQLPLRPAWAITVHKSQGLTFDRAIIDVSHSFAHGQTYVALSRCRTLEGITLSAPVTASSVMCDPVVTRFETEQLRAVRTPEQVRALRDDYYVRCVAETFGMQGHIAAFNAVDRLVSEYLGRTYPSLTGEYSAVSEALRGLQPVADKFVELCRRRVTQADPLQDSYLAERVNSAACYFAPALARAAQLLRDTPDTCDNAAGARRLKEALTQATEALYVTRHILANITAARFSPALYMKLKAQAAILLTTRSKAKTAVKKDKAAKVPSEVQNPALYAALVQWRSDKMRQLNVPAYVIASTKALISVANAAPANKRELLDCDGWGQVRVRQYGAEVLDIVAQSTVD